MNKARLLLTWAFLIAPAFTRAQPMLSNGDCEVLDTLVKRHVWLAATRVKPEQPAVSPRLSDVGTVRYVCRRAPEIATRAFSEALAALNMQIGWEPKHPGDSCLSGDLSQCYPGPVPGEPALPPGRLAFVYDAWQGVRDAVQSQMPRGGRHGVAVFSSSSLDAALASRLADSVEGPLHSRYLRR